MKASEGIFCRLSGGKLGIYFIIEVTNFAFTPSESDLIWMRFGKSNNIIVSLSISNRLPSG